MSAPEPGRPEDLSLAWVAAAIAARPRWTVGLPFVATTLAILATFLVEKRWTAVASFVPETRSMPALNPALLGLASQFGVNIGGQSGASPQFYAEVLRSREILETVLTTRFATGTGDSATLLDQMRVKGEPEARRLENGVKRLNSRLAVNVDVRTSIVRFQVVMARAELAQAVSARFLELLNEFNLRRRQSQARERRRFAEQRTAAADSALREAEVRVRDFYETNRLWESSPTLTFEEARLRRELTLRQELQLTLSRELETARIEEVNDTPVLTVIDAPDLPQRKSRPRRRVIATMTLILSSVGGAGIALLLAMWSEGMQRGHPDYALARDAVLRLVRRRPV